MATMNLPSNPSIGQEYAFGGFTYVWDGYKWTTKVNTGTGGIYVGDMPPIAVPEGSMWFCSEDGQTYILYRDGDSTQWVDANPGANSTSATGLNVVANYVGNVQWFNGERENIPAGYLPADGQLVLRTDAPELWAKVADDTFKVTTDASWLDTGDTDPLGKVRSRGMYSIGDGVSNFRLPDLNGVQPNSIRAAFLRGHNPDEEATYGYIGKVMPDGAPNITGAFGQVMFTEDLSATNAKGAFQHTSDTYFGGALKDTGGTPVIDNGFFDGYEIDASNSSASYGRSTEVRPNSVTGVWIICARGVFITEDEEAVKKAGDIMTGTLVAPAVVVDAVNPTFHLNSEGVTVGRVASESGTMRLINDTTQKALDLMPDGSLNYGDVARFARAVVNSATAPTLALEINGMGAGRILQDSDGLKLINDAGGHSANLANDGTMHARAFMGAGGRGFVRVGDVQTIPGGSQTEGYEIQLTNGITSDCLFFTRGVIDGVYHYAQMVLGTVGASTIMDLRSDGGLYVNGVRLTTTTETSNLTNEVALLREEVQASVDASKEEVLGVVSKLVTLVDTLRTEVAMLKGAN